MKTGSITYNGKNSLTDLGIYVTGSGSFDAAELDVDRYEVAGRNGDIIIPKNRYKNIPISYPAFIPNGFDGKVQSVRNWLRRAKTYARLEDTYDVNHFRLGLANGVQSFEPVNRNDASNFQLNFDCRPERFLKTGETPLTIEPEAHSHSGEIVSFETVAVDDMTKATVSLSPIQSLNGYDHPWAGGAGVNKLPETTFSKINDSGIIVALTSTTLNGCNATKVEVTGTASSWGWRVYQSGIRNIIQPNTSYRITFLANAAYTFTGLIQTVASTNKLANNFNFTRTQLSNGLYQYSATSTTYEADNSAWNANDQVFMILANPSTTSPFTATLINGICLTLASDPEGWSPYENLCPISGHTGATLNVTGKNVWDEEWEVGGISSTTGENAISTQSIRTKNYIPVVPNATYFAYVSGSSTLTLKTRWYDANKNFLGATPTINYGSQFTVPSNACYLRFCPQDAYGTTYNNDISINYPSTDHEYHAYVGNQYTSSFGQTVYGGTFDFVSGKLTVTQAVKDLGSLSWTYYTGASIPMFYADIGAGAHTVGNPVKLLCSQYKAHETVIYATDFAQLGYGNIGVNGQSYWYRILVTDDRYTDAPTFTTAMSGVQLVYELATPIEIDLTPAQVQTLLGLNNVWASDGTVEINYADPFNVDNPTYFEARPLFEITNPAQNDMLNVNGKTITFLSSYTGTVTIDCETMNCYSGYANMNYLISATDFPVLNEGLNIVTWSGSGTCKMTPRWWEL